MSLSHVAPMLVRGGRCRVARCEVAADTPDGPYDCVGAVVNSARPKCDLAVDSTRAHVGEAGCFRMIGDLGRGGSVTVSSNFIKRFNENRKTEI
eukprot:4789261-Prymnesium_polylepis.3